MCSKADNSIDGSEASQMPPEAAGIESPETSGRATFDELTAKGFVFVQEPTERPYGVEAVFRDDFGNWLGIAE
jgi:catechol 2,3-dioxygenase-like lactoylglutathione lyase family enzyme